MYPTLEARYAELVDIHNLLCCQGSDLVVRQPDH